MRGGYGQGCGDEQPTLRATDRLDDGSVIAVAIQIDPQSGEAYISFEHTDPELYGNLNAPKAVVYSAVIYVLRCLVRHDIPLNQVWCAECLRKRWLPRLLFSGLYG